MASSLGRQADGRTGGWADGRVGGRTDGQATGGRTDGRVDGWAGGQMGGRQTGGRADGRTGQADGCPCDTCAFFFALGCARLDLLIGSLHYFLHTKCTRNAYAYCFSIVSILNRTSVCIFSRRAHPCASVCIRAHFFPCASVCNSCASVCIRAHPCAFFCAYPCAFLAKRKQLFEGLALATLPYGWSLQDSSATISTTQCERERERERKKERKKERERKEKQKANMFPCSTSRSWL